MLRAWIFFFDFGRCYLFAVIVDRLEKGTKMAAMKIEVEVITQSTNTYRIFNETHTMSQRFGNDKLLRISY